MFHIFTELILNGKRPEAFTPKKDSKGKKELKKAGISQKLATQQSSSEASSSKEKSFTTTVIVRKRHLQYSTGMSKKK